MDNISSLKQRIFWPELIQEEEQEIFQNNSQFELEEVLESLTRQREEEKTIEDVFVFNPEERKSFQELEEQILFVNEKPESKLLLYQLSDNMYYVYQKNNAEKEIWKNHIPDLAKLEETSYDMFEPTGLVVRRVPQNILGTGVLGRAFLGQNYIEILDSLSGNAYQEVLTHEILHIIYPQKREAEIRHLTRNYVGNKAVYH